MDVVRFPFLVLSNAQTRTHAILQGLRVVFAYNTNLWLVRNRTAAAAAGVRVGGPVGLFAPDQDLATSWWSASDPNRVREGACEGALRPLFPAGNQRDKRMHDWGCWAWGAGGCGVDGLGLWGPGGRSQAEAVGS